MENPATWKAAEHVVHDALMDWSEARERGVIGLSQVRTVTDALRKAGLLKDAHDLCPECGWALKIKWSGVECSKCSYWCCL